MFCTYIYIYIYIYTHVHIYVGICIHLRTAQGHLCVILLDLALRPIQAMCSCPRPTHSSSRRFRKVVFCPGPTAAKATRTCGEPEAFQYDKEMQLDCCQRFAGFLFYDWKEGTTGSHTSRSQHTQRVAELRGSTTSATTSSMTPSWRS